MYTLENKLLKITVKPKGAELSSIFSKSQNREVLWQADPNYWARHAPILFPIVGQVRDGKYTIENQEFEMSQHGFARDQEFEMINKDKNEIRFKLTQNDQSLKQFPFKFTLLITYSIFESTLTVAYTVVNNGHSKLPFSIGAHPGFNLPFDKNSSIENYSLIFNKKEKSDRILFENGLLNGKKEFDFLNQTNTIDLHHSIFDNDALIFKNLQSDQVVLKNNLNNQSVKFNFKGFPYLGIWSKPKSNAPFICIEPWHGVTDNKTSPQDFSQKEGRITLDINKEFNCNYSIEV